MAGIPYVIKLEVTLASDANVEELSDAIFDYLAADPDDLFPGILTVDNIDVIRPRD